MKRDSVVIYRDLFEGLMGVPERSYKRIMNAILAYAMDGVEPKLNGLEFALFNQTKTKIDANNQKYENGKQGGRPRNQSEENDNQTETKNNQDTTTQEPNDNQTETKQNQTITKGNQTETKPNLNVKCKMLNDKGEMFKEKERKKENINIKNNTHVRESYDELIDDWGCSPPVKAALGRFIRHCTLNGQKLTNDRLDSIIRELDFTQGLSDEEQIQALDSAVAKGYFDVKRSERTYDTGS